MSDASEVCIRCAALSIERRCAACGVTLRAGDYRVVQLLNEGQQSNTFLAEGPRGKVFLKELAFALVPDARAIAAFSREAQLLRELHHPSIPQYVASFSEGEGSALRLYLVERFVEGTSLEKELLSHRYDERELREIAKKVLAVLLYLHEHSPPVLHRDIKPSNLIRAKSGALMVVDFGSARDAAGHLPAGVTSTGTFGYAAPEQLSGYATSRSDLYSLGATLAHLIARRPPWELISVGVGIDLTSLHVSAGFKRWLARLLDVVPAKRFPTARAALKALDAPVRSATRTAGLAMLLVAVVVGAAEWKGVGARAALARYRDSKRVHPEGTTERCPVGGVLAGAPPPLGREHYCAVEVNGVLVKDGPSVKWFDNGVGVKELATFKDGLMEGPYELTIDGPQKGQYKAGWKQGRWTIGGQSGDFDRGKKTGEWVSTTPLFDGGTAAHLVLTFEDDRVVGDVGFYATTTQKEWENISARPGKPGLAAQWYQDGTRKVEKTLGPGLGVYTNWHPNGQISSTCEMRNELKSGACSDFRADGSRISETYFLNGERVGTHVRFDEYGHETTRCSYDKGEAALYREVDFQGRKTRDGALTPKGQWLINAYYPDGKRSAEYEGTMWPDCRIVAGGPFKGWHPSGVRHLEGAMLQDTRVGVWTEYFPSGSRLSIMRYGANGGLLGDFEEFFDRTDGGGLRLTGSYYYGRRTGEWIARDKSGRVVAREALK